MPIPPIQKSTQAKFIKTALRLPPSLHADIQDAAVRNGRSMNAEIVARLQESPLEAIAAELGEVKSMVRRLLDQA